MITIGADARVIDAIKTINSHHISGLPVVGSAGTLVGIVSETWSDRTHRPPPRCQARPNRGHAPWGNGHRPELDRGSVGTKTLAASATGVSVL
ncbi:MAG: CBS domain-containing protein [Acidobacteriaceae bacterium]|nr:CBS domain-containing protein [Acidobacteriaceae bacterium]